MWSFFHKLGSPPWLYRIAGTILRWLLPVTIVALCVGVINHTKFPLTQGHNISDCAKCHINGNYSNVSTDCKSCHQKDYNATTNPVHSTLAFSTTCTECHTTAPGWKPAKYTQHDALSFPIYSGKHQGQWNSCTDCHSNASNYKEFNCLNCHAHNKTDMDDKHKGESGYAYISASCLNCHPKGIVN